jgi:hypothetical protein
MMSKEKKSERNPTTAFDATLSAIKAATQTLNRAADEASEEIEALEQQLSDIDPGVNVWTGVLFQEPTTYGAPNGIQNGLRLVKLGYLKGKKGGLVVREDVLAPDGTIVHQTDVSLRKAERETRLMLRSSLPDVLGLVLSTLSAQVSRLPPVAATPEVLEA